MVYLSIVIYPQLHVLRYACQLDSGRFRRELAGSTSQIFVEFADPLLKIFEFYCAQTTSKKAVGNNRKFMLLDSFLIMCKVRQCIFVQYGIVLLMLSEKYLCDLDEICQHLPFRY